jgi:hypothetical protein
MDFTKRIKKYTEVIQVHDVLIKNILVGAICFGIFPSIISESNYLYGILFTMLATCYMYLVHMTIHLFETNNILSSIHIYHHTHNDKISYYGEIFIETLFVNMTVILNMYLNNTLSHIFMWSTIYYTTIYSLVHNINYGVLKLNNYHQLHHKDPNTNFGIDICDYLCNTKHVETPDIEDASHYLPPAILSFFFVLALKELMKNATFTYIFNVVNILSVGIFILLTLYIYYCL